MKKISYDEYLKLARNPETNDEDLLAYSKVIQGEGGFDFKVVPDPDKVEMKFEDLEFENAMKIGNELSRFRRQARFRRRKLFGSKLPVLVAEGDSWFEFPLLIKEIIDQLDDDFLIWSIGAAGDTVQNMVYGRAEYPKALNDRKHDVKGFLFSAAGNDIIGEDPSTQSPVLLDLLLKFNGDKSDVKGHININLLEEKLKFLTDAYSKVISTIRNEVGLGKLPIFIHGYDYAIPYPANTKDPRNPIYASKNQWLGSPLDKRNIKDPTLRHEIIKFMIDRLYETLFSLAGDSKKTGVWVVDCRGAMPNVKDWNDEIHGTSDGFRMVAKRFVSTIKKAI